MLNHHDLNQICPNLNYFDILAKIQIPLVYTSIIDELGIDIQTMSELDSTSIIRLQKQLKAKSILNKESNLGETADLIESLNNEGLRNHHIFIEKNPWLKKLLQGQFENINVNEIKPENDSIKDLDGLKQFLEPYLHHQIKPFFSNALSKGHYLLMQKVLEHNYLFSEEVNLIIINLFKTKLNYATVYLSEGKLKRAEAPIAFIGNKTFIKCLNNYPDAFTEEINEVNSEVIEIYNSHVKNTSNPSFLFCAKAMVAFGLLDVANEFLKDILVSNANIAREWTEPHRRRKSSSGMNPWAIAVALMLVVRLIFYVGKSTSSHSPSNNNYFDNLNINYVNYEQDNNLKTLNMIHYILPLMYNKSTKLNSIPLEIYQNPYENSFHRFYKPNSDSDISRNMTYIKNKTGKDLIMFVLYKNDDKSVFIPQNDSIVVQIEVTDTLAFYSGKNFIGMQNGNVRFFEKERHLSSLYVIDSINIAEPHYIDVFPEIQGKDITQNGRNLISDSLIFHNIVYTKSNDHKSPENSSIKDMIKLKTN